MTRCRAPTAAHRFRCPNAEASGNNDVSTPASSRAWEFSHGPTQPSGYRPAHIREAAVLLQIPTDVAGRCTCQREQPRGAWECMRTSVLPSEPLDEVGIEPLDAKVSGIVDGGHGALDDGVTSTSHMSATLDLRLPIGAKHRAHRRVLRRLRLQLTCCGQEGHVPKSLLERPRLCAPGAPPRGMAATDIVDSRHSVMITSG